MYLPDVRTDTLKPESINPQQLQVPVTLMQSNSIEEKTDDLLLDVDGEETKEQGNQISNQILQDLNDLQFDEKKSPDKGIDGKRISLKY